MSPLLKSMLTISTLQLLNVGEGKEDPHHEDCQQRGIGGH